METQIQARRWQLGCVEKTTSECIGGKMWNKNEEISETVGIY